jgi:hypothetical protein
MFILNGGPVAIDQSQYGHVSADLQSVFTPDGNVLVVMYHDADGNVEQHTFWSES